MPVRQATSTAVRGQLKDRAAEEPKKPRRNGLRGKGTALGASRTPLREDLNLPTLVQSHLDLSEPDSPVAPTSTSPSLSILTSPSAGGAPETTSSSSLADVMQEDESARPSVGKAIGVTPRSERIIDASAPEGGVAIRPNGSSSHSAADGDIDYHHDSEAEFGRLLDYYGIEWQYEPHQFPLEWRDGRPIVMFTPDFYLPEYDLYIELTTMRQSLVRRKNRKLRLLRALYPEINIKLLYRRDYHRLLQRFGIAPEELDAEAIASQVITPIEPGQAQAGESGSV